MGSAIADRAKIKASRVDDFFGRPRVAMFGRPSSPRQHNLHARLIVITGRLFPFLLRPSSPGERDKSRRTGQ